MAVSDDPSHPRSDAESWAARFRAARLVIAVAALIFLALILGDAIPAGPALLAFVAIGLAALLGAGNAAAPAASAGSADATAARIWRPLLERVLAALPDPVVALDHDGVVVAVNARATALAPLLRPGEPASLALRMPAIVEAIRRAATSGNVQRVEFSERVPLDRWYEAYVIPTDAASFAGDVDLLLLTFHDLTAQRRVEEMRADFVANASHELRTPLAALSGFIETLQGPARNDAVARDRFLGIMKQQATRMARLIDDLLSLSRIELNVHVRPETPVDLVAVVRQVIDGLQTLARDRGVKIVVEAPPEPLVVRGDRDELIRVFENLIENALKYGASGERVDVVLAREAGASGAPEVVASVRDYGPGIPAEHLPRLTERFYRVDVGQSREQGGTGLGLAIVKHIINRHRGRLAIDSPPGQGATFTVRLGAVALPSAK